MKAKKPKSVREMLLAGKTLNAKMFKEYTPKHLYKRVFDLRSRGYVIKSEVVKGVTHYTLKKAPKKAAKIRPTKYIYVG